MKLTIKQGKEAMKNKQYASTCFSLMLVTSLVLLPGCFGKKKDKKEVKKMCQTTGGAVPLAGKKGSSKYFDDRVEALVLDNDAADVYARSIHDTRKAENNLAAADREWSAHQQNKLFEAVLFDFDRYEIRPDQQPVVAYNAEKAREEVSQGKALKVEGHADKQYLSEVYNIAVSDKRAQTVKKALAKAGVDSTKISAVGYGDKYPAVDVAGREQKNRRAEIVAL